MKVIKNSLYKSLSLFQLCHKLDLCYLARGFILLASTIRHSVRFLPLSKRPSTVNEGRGHPGGDHAHHDEPVLQGQV